MQQINMKLASWPFSYGFQLPPEVRPSFAGRRRLKKLVEVGPGTWRVHQQPWGGDDCHQTRCLDPPNMAYMAGTSAFSQWFVAQSGTKFVGFEIKPNLSGAGIWNLADSPISRPFEMRKSTIGVEETLHFFFQDERLHSSPVAVSKQILGYYDW